MSLTEINFRCLCNQICMFAAITIVMSVLTRSSVFFRIEDINLHTTQEEKQINYVLN